MLGLLYAVGLPVAVFAGLFLAPLFAVGAVALAALALAGRGTIAPPARPLAIVCALIGLWAVASSFWSPAAPESTVAALRLAATLAGGLVLTGAAVRLDAAPRLRRMVLFGVVAALVLILADMLSGNLLSRVLRAGPHYASLEARRFLAKPDRGATVVALTLVPCLCLLLAEGRRRAALLLLLLGGAALMSTVSLAAKLGFGIALPVAVAGWRWPSAIRRLVMIALLGAIVAMPLVARAIPDDAQAMWNRELPIPDSTFHRLVIWRFAADRIAERPLLGWGFEASREIPGGKTEFVVRRTNSRTGREEKVVGGLLPLHPHNGILQVWLELGALGAALLAALVVAILGAIGRINEPFARAGALGAFIGSYVIFCVSYGAWQSWWLASLWLVAALVAALSRAARRNEAAAVDRTTLRA